MPDCIHYDDLQYEGGREIGTCRYCGQVRQYPRDGRGIMVILKPGRIIPREQIKEVKKVQTKPDPGMTHLKKRDFWQGHKIEIVADLKKIGKPATERKWGISSSGITKMIRDWMAEGLLTKREFKAMKKRSHAEAIKRRRAAGDQIGHKAKATSPSLPPEESPPAVDNTADPDIEFITTSLEYKLKGRTISWSSSIHFEQMRGRYGASFTCLATKWGLQISLVFCWWLVQIHIGGRTVDDD